MTTIADVHRPAGAGPRLVGPPRPVRLAFGLLERGAPALGARWAGRLWFTLPRTSRPRVAGDTEFTVAVNGRAVVGTTWGAGPTVYLVHGWGGNRDDLAAFAGPLVARGHRVVAFDAPSHGASAPGAFGPRSSSLPEFVDALTAVVAAQGPAHAVIAHSLGAAAAAAALCDGLPAGRLAMLAPMASPAWYARHFAARLGFGERTHRHLMRRAQRRIGAPMHHFDVPELGQAIGMPPTFVVHDRNDPFIPFTHATAIARAWPGSRLRVTSGLGHRRLLRDPAVVAEVVDFVHNGSPTTGRKLS